MCDHIYSLWRNPQIALLDESQHLPQLDLHIPESWEAEISDRFIDVPDILKQMESLVNGTFNFREIYECPPIKVE